VRSFVIGVTLLVLLFGGFVIGVEAGTHPMEQAAVTRIVAGSPGSLHAMTVRIPTVIHGRTRLVTVPSTERNFVVVRRDGRIVLLVEPRAGSTGMSGPQSAASPTAITLPTSTVTEPGSTVTVTDPGTTVTVTVTESGTTDTTATSNVSSSSP